MMFRLKTWCSVTLFLVFFTGQLVGQQVMTPELLWELKRVSSPILSPDGNYLLFGVTVYDVSENKGNRDLYIYDLQVNTVKQVTDTKGSEFNECWTPDGKNIAYLSAESGTVQVYESNISGDNKKQKTNISEGVSGFMYSPKGTYISFFKAIKLDQTAQDKYPNLPESEVRIIDDLMYRHWDSWHDYTYSHIMIAANKDGITEKDLTDLMQGERYNCPLKPFGGLSDMAWHPDESVLVYVCKKELGKAAAKSTNSNLYVYNLSDKSTKNITSDNQGYDTEPKFSSDGKQLAWLRMSKPGFEADKKDLVLMNWETKELKNLTEKEDITLSVFSWSPDAKNIYFESVKEATQQHFAIDLKKASIIQITEGQHNLGEIVTDGKTIYSTKTDMNHASEIVKIDAKKGTITQLTKFNNEIYDKIEKSKVEKRWVTTSDGKKMLTWVIYPPDFDPSKKYPTLLYCQGGPQSAVSQFYSFRWNFQLMAAKGYIVVAPNRRGLPGFGQEWNDAISTDWGGQPMKDYLAAIDDVAKEPYVDKERLGAVGASYGGYSVYYLAGIHEKRFKAFISHCGVFNLESWYGMTEELFFANEDIGGPYWMENTPKSYELFSPHKLVQNWDTPILVIHGGKDFRVPESEGMQAFQAAQLLNIPSKFLYFPNEGHWVLKPQNGLVWHSEFFEWLDKWLK